MVGQMSRMFIFDHPHVKALRPRFVPLFLDGTFRPRAFPRRDRLHYHFQASERALDIAVYTLSLRFEKFLEFMEFER